VYKKVDKNSKDIIAITEIYNKTTGRNRTFDQHQWEWFGSPYENLSYIISNKNEVIGHHGILSVELSYKNKRYKMGKTENTIIKKGFGAVYPKHEMAMFKEYVAQYDVLMTTAAWGVTRRIREKLGYKPFARYVSYVAVIDVSYISTKVNNRVVKILIKLISPFVNLFISKKKKNTKCTHKFKKLDIEDLNLISGLYEEVKSEFGFMQTRSYEFLKYRYLDNLYLDFFVMYEYEGESIIGAVIYTLMGEELIIEDVLVKNETLVQGVFNALYNHVLNNKLAKVITFSTLINSILDKKYKHFYRREANEGSSIVMVRDNMKCGRGLGLTAENLYFTRLTNEGVS